MLSVALLLLLLSSWTLSFKAPMVKAEPGWLSGWENRVKVTIDSGDVDSDLSDFPVLVYLSTSSGYNNDDVSFVFDELQSDNNRKKIAVTKGDGTSQCYVEIEKWDDANEQAWLWVKVPSVSSGADTDLYLYYDSDHADNTAYVGDPDSTAAENVWDSGFKGVWHLDEEGDGTLDEYKDSTQYNNHGQGGEGNSSYIPTRVTGAIGFAQNFTDDLIDCGDGESLNITGYEITLECWMNYPNNTHPYMGVYNRKGWYNGSRLIMGENSQKMQFQLPGQDYSLTMSQDIPNNTWHYIAAVYNSTYMMIYLDGSQDPQVLQKNDAIPPSGPENETWIGTGDQPIGEYWRYPWEGLIDEVRVSNVTRNAAWIRATYESEIDDTIDFGSEESVEVDTYELDYTTPKDTYSLTETVYAKATGIENQIGWLSGWGNRVKLTISSGDVDSDLSDFPVLVHLSTSSGYNNDDVSFVFDELQSDANRKKIAVTKSDGTTECYVEIEKWNDASEKAWLWVKVSGTNSVSSSTDTDLYLYYDADHADNTAYVGDSGSRTEVWDSSFAGVWHLGESSSTRYDSTSNDNDLAPLGTVSASSSGRVGSAASFAISPEGSLYIADNAVLSITGDLTISGWMNMATLPSAGGDEMTIAAKWDTNERSYHLRISDESPPDGTKAHISSNGTNDFDAEGGTTLSTSTWYYVTLVNDDTDFRLYLNDFLDTSSDNPESHGLGIYDGTAAFHIGRQTDLSDEMNGLIDEVRISNTDRSAAWVKASYESDRDHLIDFGTEETGWLSGWGNRVKLTIDSGDVDSDLSDFPLLVYLSTSSGRLSDDVSFVFDELQSDANRNKIAVTKSDGTTECYVEIEGWDDAGEEAWLWVKVSGTNSISSTTDTDLYLYYDADHADNTAYVGDTDSTTAQNVWDNDHMAVWHLGETTGGSAAMKDSTSNNNDGTDYNNPSLGFTGKIGNAVDFDGNNDYINCSDTPSLDISGTNLTISAWIAPDFTRTSAEHYVVVDKRSAVNQHAYRLFFQSGVDDWRFILTTAPLNVQVCDTLGVTWNVDEWHYVAATFGSPTMRIYWDGVQNNTATRSGSITTTNYPLLIGYQQGGGIDTYFDGTIDEVRISNGTRSAAWIKASYESGRDHLIDFGSDESRRCDFRYYSDWTGTPDLEWEDLDKGESPSGGWRSSYELQGTDPTGTWGVKVFEAGTSILICSCSFTVQAVPEFPHGVTAALVACLAIYLVKRHRGKRWRNAS